MSSLAARLPHGVRLPTTLQPEDALDLIKALAAHYGCAHLLLTPDDVEDHLTANRTTAAGQHRRRLSAEEWTRLYGTDAWRHLPTAAHAVTARNILSAIRQAALECVRCATPLTGPPTATWGHCPACLIDADIDELRHRPCPAAGADAPHRWGPQVCDQCGIPTTDTPTSRPRRLTAVPAAA
ncbi:hypothetical protein GCM10020358_69020 [Amorphoplanes nipponensis]|uniref:Uncharacterized protein n=1 Tax=Actinoplanes nipponensis TaxID=135950 RepID=A0A919JPQ8_9ACTN|nr:hypothetical protein [Actinoplanes nipponensis]GIE53207.1 hypothetical protein Ani05nite_67410 [Actinoplanes nipponensis]